jgi:hypothetical protein
MSEHAADTASGGILQNFMAELPTDRLREELGSFLGLLAQRDRHRHREGRLRHREAHGLR